MRKKSDDELGVLITREIKAMMFNEKLSAEQKVSIFCSIVDGKDIEDPLLSAFADALKTGYIHANDARKASIYNRRQRQLKYSRTSTETGVDNHSSTEIGVDSHSSPIKGKGKGKGNNIPLNPPSGVEGKIPSAISPEDILVKEGAGAGRDEAAVVKDWALWLADELESTDAWSHMRVNRAKLMKCLCSVLKKNGGAALAHETVRKIKGGLLEHTQCWAADDWRYAPGKITDWLYDGKWLEEPRKKEAAAVGSGCGECGVEIG